MTRIQPTTTDYVLDKLKSKEQIKQLVELMMWANSNNEYASTYSVFGHCRKAIIDIVREEVGVSIANVDWNVVLR